MNSDPASAVSVAGIGNPLLRPEQLQAATGAARAFMQLLPSTALTTQADGVSQGSQILADDPGDSEGGPDLVGLIADLVNGLLLDPLVGEDAGQLIRRLVAAFKQTVLSGDLFFADENHPARALIDALPVVCLNSDPRDRDRIEQALQEVIGVKDVTRECYAAALDGLAPMLARHEQALVAAAKEIAGRYHGRQAVVASLQAAGPGAGTKSSVDAPAALQPWLARADKLLCGFVYLYSHQESGVTCPASLVWKAADGKTFVWLIHRHFKPLCLTRQELAMALRRSSLRALEAIGEGLCERVLCRRLYTLHDRVQQHAINDPVTGLVKRRHFEQEIRAALRRAASVFDPDHLSIVALDNYQDIVQSHGRQAVNKLMSKLARLLKRQLREAGLACRINEQCFAILINVGERDAALGYMQRFRRSVAQAHCIFKGRPCSISVSLGLIPLLAELANVAGAMALATHYRQRAWEAGGNQLCSPLLLSTTANSHACSVASVQAGDPDVRELLRSGRLALRAQRVQGISEAAGDRPYYEILLGVRAADGHLAPPGPVIAVAEKSGFITELDRWVIRTALQWMTAKPERLARVSGYAMNLSGISLCDESLPADVLGYIKAAGVAPEKLIFEVTETAGFERLSVAQRFTRALRGLGCGLSLDDVGSGHASFAYLKTLPVDKIKIDGMFVRDITSNPDDYAVVRSINEIAHAMGRLTVAEFVEDDETLAVLDRIGVDYVQGYGIEKPVPIDEIQVLKTLVAA